MFLANDSMKAYIYILTLFSFSVLAGEVAPRSKWDEKCLSVQLGNVNIEAENLIGAWQAVTTDYLLRANLYADVNLVSDRTHFVFRQKQATGKDILGALLANYPALTYTQDPTTGIIWLHPKRLDYQSILSQRINVTRDGRGLSMYTEIYIPLCSLLAPEFRQFVPRSDPITRKKSIPDTFLYEVDLTKGIVSARDILNVCCLANPSTAFQVSPDPNETNVMMIRPRNLMAMSPLVPPRITAIKLWEMEIGKPANGIPSLDEVRIAMSDASPAKRTAACLYLEACIINYAPKTLVDKASSSEQAVWVILGLQRVVWRGFYTNYFGESIRMSPRLGADLRKIESPNLALIALLQMTIERQNSSYLDVIVNKHTYTDEDIASVKPELDRLARSSRTVRDKLRALNLQVANYSKAALDDFEDANLFKLVTEPQN